MQPNDGWAGTFVEVAAHRVTHLLAQLLHAFRLRKYAVPKRTGYVATFYRFHNAENDLAIHIFNRCDVVL
jgi:hypothetical protein